MVQTENQEVTTLLAAPVDLPEAQSSVRVWTH